MRERELKLAHNVIFSRVVSSLPMRERELKQEIQYFKCYINRRSPCGSAN